MKMGMFLRNFGAAATSEKLTAYAKIAESNGIDVLWLLAD
jgi:hypothetical protein